MTRITEDTQEMVERLRMWGRPRVRIQNDHNPLKRDLREAADLIERQASQLAGVVGERDALREALEGAAGELKSCAEQFRALKMTACAQYTEAQEAKVREALSHNQGVK